MEGQSCNCEPLCFSTSQQKALGQRINCKRWRGLTSYGVLAKDLSLSTLLPSRSLNVERKCKTNPSDPFSTHLLMSIIQLFKYSTCENECYPAPRFYRSSSDETFTFSAAELWNSLPLEVKLCKSLAAFTSAVRMVCFSLKTMDQCK